MNHTISFGWSGTPQIVACVNATSACRVTALTLCAQSLAAKLVVWVRTHATPCDTTNATEIATEADYSVWRGDIGAPEAVKQGPNFAQSLILEIDLAAGESLSILATHASEPAVCQIELEVE